MQVRRTLLCTLLHDDFSFFSGPYKKLKKFRVHPFCLLCCKSRLTAHHNRNWASVERVSTQKKTWNHEKMRFFPKAQIEGLSLKRIVVRCKCDSERKARTRKLFYTFSFIILHFKKTKPGLSGQNAMRPSFTKAMEHEI